jgi:hypothetical protein
LSLPLAHPVFGLADRPLEQAVGVLRRAVSQWSNRSRIAFSTMRKASSRGKLLFGLADEFRIADEDREQGAAPCRARRRP